MKFITCKHLILPRQRAWLPLKDRHALEIDLRTVSSKIDMLPIENILHPVLNIHSICTV